VRTNRKSRFTLPLALVTMASLSGCSDENPTIVSAASTNCMTGVAQISVRDGYLDRLCGCAEPRTTIYPPHSLTCTVNVGTTVAFSYAGTATPHQILSTGSPSFISSAPSNPGTGLIDFSHLVHFTAAGTYQFTDAFEATEVGQIIVQ